MVSFLKGFSKQVLSQGQTSNGKISALNMRISKDRDLILRMTILMKVDLFKMDHFKITEMAKAHAPTKMEKSLRPPISVDEDKLIKERIQVRDGAIKWMANMINTEILSKELGLVRV